MRPITIGLALLLALPPLPGVPPAWNPFLPLDLAAPITPVTDWKLARIAADPGACLAALDSAPDLAWTRIPDQVTAPGCGFETAVRVSRGSLALRPGSTALACPLAARYALFEANAVAPAAAEHLSQRVTAIRHLGSYACRNLYGRADAARSAHATAEALDVAGFVLTDGSEISLVRHWDDPGPRGAFLRAVRDKACRWFSTVLGPDYNQAHADHFHLEVGGPRVCR